MKPKKQRSQSYDIENSKTHGKDSDSKDSDNKDSDDESDGKDSDSSEEYLHTYKVKKQTHTFLKFWQSKYVWIKNNNVFYSKYKRNDDFKKIIIKSSKNISKTMNIIKIISSGKTYLFKCKSKTETKEMYDNMISSYKNWQHVEKNKHISNKNNHVNDIVRANAETQSEISITTDTSPDKEISIVRKYKSWTELMLNADNDERDRLTEKTIEDYIKKINKICNGDEIISFDKILEYEKLLLERMNNNINEIKNLKNNAYIEELSGHQIIYFISLLKRLIMPFVLVETPYDVEVAVSDDSDNNISNELKLSHKQLLNVVDFFESLKENISAIKTNEVIKNKCYIHIRHVVQNIVDKYMEKSKPMINACVDKLIIKSRDETINISNKISNKTQLISNESIKKEIVSENVSKHLKTHGPADLMYFLLTFYQLSNNIKSSYLQRNVLSFVFSKMTFYSKEMLSNVIQIMTLDSLSFDKISQNPIDKLLIIKYLCALVNDMGKLLNQLEQYEKIFNDVLEEEEFTIKQLYKSFDQSQNNNDVNILDENNNLDIIISVKQDLPRSKTELHDASLQICEMIQKCVIKNSETSLNKLFEDNWIDVDNFATICDELIIQIDDLKVYLDKNYFEHVAFLVFYNVIEIYLIKLFLHLRVHKYFSSNKITHKKLEKLTAELKIIRKTMRYYLSDIKINMILKLHSLILKLISINLPDVETIVKTELNEYVIYAPHIFLLVKECIENRTDVDKKNANLFVENIKKYIETNSHIFEHDMPNMCHLEISYKMNYEHIIGRLLRKLYTSANLSNFRFVKSTQNFNPIDASVKKTNNKSIELVDFNSFLTGKVIVVEKKDINKPLESDPQPKSESDSSNSEDEPVYVPKHRVNKNRQKNNYFDM